MLRKWGLAEHMQRVKDVRWTEEVMKWKPIVLKVKEKGCMYVSLFFPPHIFS